MTQVRFNADELRDIVAIMELLDGQSNGDAVWQFTEGAMEWHAGDDCDGWIEWDDGQFWFVPASNIAAGELDEYKQKHCEQQEEIYRLRRQVEECQKELDDRTPDGGDGCEDVTVSSDRKRNDRRGW